MSFHIFLIFLKPIIRAEAVYYRNAGKVFLNQGHLRIKFILFNAIFFE